MRRAADRHRWTIRGLIAVVIEGIGYEARVVESLGMTIPHFRHSPAQCGRVDDERLVPQAERVRHLGRDACGTRLPLRDDRLTLQLRAERFEIGRAHV